MEDEQLNIFDSKGILTGTASRAEAHKIGLWHETFHCWFIEVEGHKTFIHFQLRSPDKKDFSNMLDITAAGHLTAGENAADGVREIKEELGISLTLNDLIYAGKIADEIIIGDFIDREFCHVFIYKIPPGKKLDYVFQDKEVAGLVKIELSEFEKIWTEEISSLMINGNPVSKNNFVPHEKSYITSVMNSIKQVFL